MSMSMNKQRLLNIVLNKGGRSVLDNISSASEAVYSGDDLGKV